MLSNHTAAVSAGLAHPNGRAPRHIAYVMSRFPKMSETFVLYELLELERLGVQVDIFPLIRERETVVHAEAQPLVDRAHYSKAREPRVLKAQQYWAARNPKAYAQAWAAALQGNIGSPKFLSRTIVATTQAMWFAKRMEELGIEHVHAHFATHAALAAYVIKTLTGIPYSFTAHADDIYVDQSMLGEKIREAAFVASISDYNRRFMRALYGSIIDEKVEIVRCGVDSGVFAPRSVPPAHEKLEMTCVARLDLKKGHTYLIEACAILRDRGIPFRLRLIGDGDLQAEIEAQIAQLSLGEQIEMLGGQPRHRVRELLAESDVMVLPSITTAEGKQEGIPVALMEAMAVELPVVSTTTSGIPELIEHGRTGLLVPERNPVTLANALMLLAQNPQLGPMLGAAGRQKVLNEFDLRKNAALLYGYMQQAATRAAAEGAK